MGAWGQEPEVWDGNANTDWYNSPDENGWYHISTAEDLAGLAKLVNDGNDFSGKTIKLGNDIQLNNTSGWESWETTPPENSWTPIGVSVREPLVDYYFRGTFDGQGHTIRGIYINTSDHVKGLFGFVDESGKIQNLTVAESYICGKGNFVGGIVGQNRCGTVSNCSNSGTVTGGFYVGGIVGWNTGSIFEQSSGTVSNCSNSGTVSGETVGGIVGWNDYGTVSNCSNSGTVSGETVGGIVGWNTAGIQSSGMVSNCYYLESTCEKGIGQDDNNQAANVKVKSEAEYKSGEVLLLLDNKREIWGQDFDKGYPVPLGSLSAEEQATAKVYSATFTYTLPDAQEESVEIKYGNSDTQLTEPEVKVPDGYTFAWNKEVPTKFGTTDLTFNGTFTKKPATTYTLTINQPENGTISATVNGTPISGEEVAEGATVTLTATPNSGYELGSWSVTDADNNEVTVTNNTFTMPANNVTVTATFSAVSSKKQPTASDFVFSKPDWTYKESAFDLSSLIKVADGVTGMGTFTVSSWQGTEEVAPINAGTYTVKVSVEEGESYLVATDLTSDDWVFVIKKADPPYTIPTGLNAIYGETLKDVTLPDGWAWEDESLSVGDAGKQPTFKATFTPEDTKNYNIVADVDLTVTVGKADPTPAETPSSYTATVGDRLSSIKLPEGWTWEDDPSTLLDEEGSHSFGAIFTPEDTENYNTIRQVVTVTVNKPEPGPEPGPTYFTLDFDDHPCEGVTLNSNLTAVEEGGTLYLYVEKEDETLYDYDDMRIYAKRGANADWEELTEDPNRPGVYPIERIWTDIFIKVEGVTPKDPTAIERVETLRIYAADGLLHVETPTRQRVTIVSMAGALIADGEQEGARIYRDLNAGIYIVRVGDYATKVRVE